MGRTHTNKSTEIIVAYIVDDFPEVKRRIEERIMSRSTRIFNKRSETDEIREIIYYLRKANRRQKEDIQSTIKRFLSVVK